jgi:hypothetical protein
MAFYSSEERIPAAVFPITHLVKFVEQFLVVFGCASRVCLNIYVAS